jgi:O-antigen ligase/Flp pilus assembly protein TadD
MHPFPASESDAADGLRRLLFDVFFGFVLVALACLVDRSAWDVTLIPRLLALLAFLVLAVAVAAVPRVGRLLDVTVLREPVVLLYGGFMLVTCGSLAVAQNVSAGFTDLFRTLATFLTLCLTCLILPIVPRWRERVVGIFVVAGLVAAAVGVFEIGTRLGFGLHGRRAMEQITGLMSSVNLYAGVLALLLPWCLCGTVVLRAAGRAWSALAGAAVLVLVVLLQSRAAWLAVLAGAAAGAGLLLADAAGFGLSRRARGLLAAALLLVPCGLVAGIATAPADNPLAQRFRSIFVAPADPTALPREGGRLMVWDITAGMIADHPLAGVGAGNFTVRFHEYFGGDDLDFSNVDTNWLQPHNDFLWVFAEKGLPGILLFVGLFVAACGAARAILRSAATAVDRRLTLAACAALVSYATLSCFDFPLERINHQVLLVMPLAILTVIRRGLRPGVTSPRTLAAWPARFFVVPVTLAALAAGIAYSVAALRQEREVLAARRAWRAGRWEEARDAARRARTPWKTLDPLASPVAFLEGMAEVGLGRLPEGIACLEQARVDNPNRMYVLNNLGILYAQTGRLDEAIDLFVTVASRYPHQIEPFNNLAGCLIEAGRAAEAVELLEGIPATARTAAVDRNLDIARRQLAEADVAQPPESTAAAAAAAAAVTGR